MPHVEVWVDGSDVLAELSDEDLQAEITRREKRKGPPGACTPETDEWLLEQVYNHYRLRIGEAPRVLSEYVYRKLGKVI